MHENERRGGKTKQMASSGLCNQILTFSNDLLNSDLVPPDSEGSANEISACMTGARAATSSSRTRPGAHQLPTRIEELPHGVEATGGGFVTSIADEQLVSCALNYCTGNNALLRW